MNKLKELLDLVYNLEGELDDAYYSLPDYRTNEDGKSYIDGARCTLYELKSQMEKNGKKLVGWRFAGKTYKKKSDAPVADPRPIYK